MMVRHVAIDVGNVQGNILRGYRFSTVRYLFFRVEDAARACQWLEEFSVHVTNAKPWQNKPASTVNIALTHAGLQALQLPKASLSSFPIEFQQGMASRATLLGDTEDSSPDHWDGPLGTSDIHLLIMLYAVSPSALAERRRWFEEMLTRFGGLTLMYEQRGDPLPNGEEHFGYRDGFSQPSIADSGTEPCPGEGTPQADGSWKSLQPGEFILGYPDEEGLLPPAPQPDVLARDGTYLVFRKLHEHVALFRAFLQEQGKVYPGGKELLAAKLVGRWRDGTPLILSPDRMDAELVNDNNRNNDFRYGSDPNGYRCPFSAHIRRTNPREDGLGKISNRHRIIRRGVTYGTTLTEGFGDDGQERGVIFIALNSSISRQFEFIQSQWINDGNIFGLGGDKDPLIGDHQGTGKMIIPGSPPYFLSPLPRFVTVKGGDYFFMPGINALKWIAGGMRQEIFVKNGLRETKGSDMNIVQELEAVARKFAGDVSQIATASLTTLEKHLREHPEPVFALLREVKPILLIHGLAVVTRFEDVQEVLDHPSEFNVPYAPKMKAITGDFILGLDNTPQYERDLSILRLAIKREDLDRVGQIVTRVATNIVESAKGSLDVVSAFTDVVPTRLIVEYLGVPGPDEATVIEWAHLLFDDIFNNVKNDTATTRMALAAGQEMRSYLDELIVQRKAELLAGRPCNDDVLHRLLQMQRIPGLGFEDAGIRNNLIGLITGWIPTVSKSTAMGLDELLRRPQDLASVCEAAGADDSHHVEAAIFEAMRFAPQNPGLLRHCAVDYTLAKGTSRATLIPKGTNVLAATQSAMHDGHVLDEPSRFRLDRPNYHYLLFGWGLHTCFGQYINRVQIPLMCKALFRKKNLRRADGQLGELSMEGNFPAGMTVCFDE